MPYRLFPWIIALGISFLPASLSAEQRNDYSVAFVHGFLGWGDGELGPLNYWGGLDEDLLRDLERDGKEVFAVTVGPVSSNWDRAIEAYYYLKGGRVDYGAAHAAHHSHKRYGRDFPGVFPEWGTVRADGALEKLHFIAHSQGAQTVRQLIHLLAYGDEAERRYAEEHGIPLNPLFKGGKSEWAKSLVTIAGVMDGTTLAPAVEKYIPFIVKFVGAADVLLKKTGLADYVYDLKLDHFDLMPREGEPLTDYFKRFINNPALRGTDHSLYDLAPRGAAAMNRRVPIHPDVYYFSYGTSATYGSWLSGRHKPRSFVTSIFKPFASFLGSCVKNCDDGTSLDNSWLENDAVVNTRSTISPTINSQDPVHSFDQRSAPQPGVWNHLGTLRTFDHMQVVGFGNSWSDPITPFYKDVVALLQSLPQ
ncbi:lipase [Pseudobacteriovorax antillogorgiicola]|uniref:triacylglycerol lipase n=1 Tax=Pseudobacteriovorax antillogorgiicola TaxID=1513793 RepID=A0A1Y6CGY8_9BACT|nr:lipase [Pseudobacteriovorax antillogorgiicola]TCS49042.1 triacylglycerol lipase [Pseudobacteriovorax antillogorgiicola]SMF52635.1 triacylglycerol lipase [Pseudobacteriovorax antillogorgiicola]